MDGKGSCHEPVPEDMWEEAFLSSCIRALHSQYPDLPCVKLMAPLQGDTEKLFMQLALKHFWKGNSLGNAEAEPQHPYAYNALTVTLRNFFKSWQRLEAQVSLFLPLVAREPALGVHVADAFVQLGEYDRAHAVLDDAGQAVSGAGRHGDGESSSDSQAAGRGKEFVLLLKKAEVLLLQDKVDEAVTVAEEAVVEAGGDQLGWLLLADAYHRLGAVDMALVMLNEASIRPIKQQTIIGSNRCAAPPRALLLASTPDLSLPSTSTDDLILPLPHHSGLPPPPFLPPTYPLPPTRHPFPSTQPLPDL